MERFIEGDIVSIFVDDIGTLQGKILHILKNSRSVILIEINNNPEDIENWTPLCQFYVSNDKIKKGEWKIIGHQTITDIDKRKTLRLRTGNIWLEDEIIRKATDLDYKSIPNELISGFKSVENHIRKSINENKRNISGQPLI